MHLEKQRLREIKHSLESQGSTSRGPSWRAYSRQEEAICKNQAKIQGEQGPFAFSTMGNRRVNEASRSSQQLCKEVLCPINTIHTDLADKLRTRTLPWLLTNLSWSVTNTKKICWANRFHFPSQGDWSYFYSGSFEFKGNHKKIDEKKRPPYYNSFFFNVTEIMRTNSTISAQMRLNWTLATAPGPRHLLSLICFLKISFKKETLFLAPLVGASLLTWPQPSSFQALGHQTEIGTNRVFFSGLQP